MAAAKGIGYVRADGSRDCAARGPADAARDRVALRPRADRGDCPLGAVGERIGDPVPLFELVLTPRAARRAVPVLGGVTAAGFGLLAIRAR
jgi:hypothetical protein